MKIRTIVFLTIIFVMLLFFSLFPLWAYFTGVWNPFSPKSSYAYEISIELSICNESGEYVVTVEKAKEKWGRDVWDLRGFTAGIWSDYPLPSFPYQDMRLLSKLLNNETSNLTFYDVDNNGKLSVGDKFVINGTFTEGGKYFVLHSELNGQDFPIKIEV